MLENLNATLNAEARTLKRDQFGQNRVTGRFRVSSCLLGRELVF
jgi:hypothetical protein